jgi:hypothetical protein
MPFREVNGEAAGPEAVGILVPPGRRTVVVVRPRSLDFDLLLLRRGTNGQPEAAFHEAGCAEALLLARNLSRAFAADNRVVVVLTPDGRGWIQAEIGTFTLIVSARKPGQPYRPLVFADEASARQAAEALDAILCPAPDVVREIYFNTQHFAS